jgi:hypothetical protein
VESYIFHSPDEPSIDQHMVLGISLGGHSAWQVIFNEPRVTAAVIIIGCPDYMRRCCLFPILSSIAQSISIMCSKKSCNKCGLSRKKSPQLNYTHTSHYQCFSKQCLSHRKLQHLRVGGRYQVTTPKRPQDSLSLSPLYSAISFLANIPKA